MRMRALLAMPVEALIDGVQALPQLGRGQAAGGGKRLRRARQMQDVPPLEVARFGHRVEGDGKLGVFGRQHGPQLVRCPEEEPPFFALALGIGGGVEAARRGGQIAQHEVQRAPGHACQLRVAGQTPGGQIKVRKLRLVVEHLLEVGHQPVVVDRVAMEAAADLIVNAAARHALQREDGRRQRGLIVSAQRLVEQQREPRLAAGIWGRRQTRPAARHAARAGPRRPDRRSGL